MKKSGMNKKISSIFDSSDVDNDSSSDQDLSYKDKPSEGFTIDSSSAKKNPFVDSAPGREFFKSPVKRASRTNKAASKQKKMAILAIVLFGVFCFVQYHFFFNSATASTEVEDEQTEIAVKPIWIKVPEIEWSVPDKIPGNLQDPMSLKLRSSSEDEGYMMLVTGIVFSENKPAAIVNGSIVYEGQTIDGKVKIVDIKRDSIVFEKDSKQWQQSVTR